MLRPIAACKKEGEFYGQKALLLDARSHVALPSQNKSTHLWLAAGRFVTHHRDVDSTVTGLRLPRPDSTDRTAGVRPRATTAPSSCV